MYLRNPAAVPTVMAMPTAVYFSTNAIRIMKKQVDLHNRQLQRRSEQRSKSKSRFVLVDFEEPSDFILIKPDHDENALMPQSPTFQMALCPKTGRSLL